MREKEVERERGSIELKRKTEREVSSAMWEDEDSLRNPGRGKGGASYTVYKLVYIQQRRPDAADVGEIVGIMTQFAFAKTMHRCV